MSTGSYTFDPSVVLTARAIAKQCSSDVRAAIHKVLERGSPETLQSLSGMPINHTGNNLDYLGVSFLSKARVKNPLAEREAYRRFEVAEQLCSQTNTSFMSNRTPLLMGLDSGDAKLLLRRKIAHALGRFSWDEVVKYVSFGPGSVVGLPRKRSTPSNKVGMTPTVTDGAAALGEAVLKHFDLWGAKHCSFEVVPGNAVVTVPKNVKTDRIIAKEPLLNAFVQKGVGGVIRSRLYRAGVDLSDQSRNRELARLGSRTKSLATVDMSMASDTLAYNVVSELLPTDWFEALVSLRCPRGVLADGRVVHYAKFSSMGNAYTFELESLIFWALASLVVEHTLNGLPQQLRRTLDTTVSVYGDDLIVPSWAVDNLLVLLSWAGFVPNREKSFWGSNGFRESCGGHYFNGSEVTPLYLKTVERVHPIESVRYANRTRELAHLWAGTGWGCDASLLPVYQALTSQLYGGMLAKTVPAGYDGALSGELDEVRPSRSRRGWDGWLTTTWIPIYKDRDFVAHDGFIAKLIMADRPGVSREYAEVDPRGCRWKNARLYIPGQ